MSFEAIPDLLADILNEQRLTRDAVIQLAQAIAGVRATLPAAPVAAALNYATDVAPLIMAHAKAHGKVATLEKLATFGVKSGSALTPDQYPAVVAAFSA